MSGESLLEEVHELIAARLEAVGIGDLATVHPFPPDAYQPPSVLILPSPETYATYHGTHGPEGLVTINLIVRVVIGRRQSTVSAYRRIAKYLATGGSEAMSLADAITGNNVVMGDYVVSIIAREVVGFVDGVLDPQGVATPVLSCDLPTTIYLNRSAE